MKYLVLAATALGIAAMPAGNRAEAAKKIHHHVHNGYEARGSVQPNLDPFGNAAAGGNNANSMSGSNSAGSNAIGRTSGSGRS